MKYASIKFGILSLGLLTATAYGQSTRTWVSGAGNDSNPCTRTAPCATFAGAYAKTSAGGEIDAVDPGSYGPLAINHAITIDGGVGYATSEIYAPTLIAVSVAAGSGDVVILRNLNIIGLGTGTSGVSITNAASVRLQHVRVTGFTGDGISVVVPQTASVTVDDSTSNDNGGSGLFATNGSDITAVSITNSHFSGNTNGVYAADGSKITVNDSDAFGNQVGFLSRATNTLSSITLYRSNSSANTVAGLQAADGGAPATVRISKVTTHFNPNALVSGGNGNIYSFGDNSVVGAATISATIPLR